MFLTWWDHKMGTLLAGLKCLKYVPTVMTSVTRSTVILSYMSSRLCINSKQSACSRMINVWTCFSTSILMSSDTSTSFSFIIYSPATVHVTCADALSFNGTFENITDCKGCRPKDQRLYSLATHPHTLSLPGKNTHCCNICSYSTSSHQWCHYRLVLPAKSGTSTRHVLWSTQLSSLNHWEKKSQLLVICFWALSALSVRACICIKQVFAFSQSFAANVMLNGRRLISQWTLLVIIHRYCTFLWNCSIAVIYAMKLLSNPCCLLATVTSSVSNFATQTYILVIHEDGLMSLDFPEIRYLVVINKYIHVQC